MDSSRDQLRAAGNLKGLKNQQNMVKSLKGKLSRLVSVHKQLLRRYGALDLEKREARQLVSLKDARIKQLDANARARATNMRMQSERHETDMKNLTAKYEQRISSMQREIDSLTVDGFGLIQRSNSVDREGAKIVGKHTIKGGGGQVGAVSAVPTAPTGVSPAVKDRLVGVDDKRRASSSPSFFQRLKFF